MINMKKPKIKTVFLTIILSLLVLLRVSGLDGALLFIWLSYNVNIVNDFDKYQKDYQIIADKVIKLRNEGELSKEDNYVYVDTEVMQNGYDGSTIELSNKEKESLTNVEKTFDVEYPLVKIKVYEDNYIAFTPEWYPFGVVYSENGTKPNSLDLVYEKRWKYGVKILAPKWYTVEDKFQ